MWNRVFMVLIWVLSWFRVMVEYWGSRSAFTESMRLGGRPRWEGGLISAAADRRNAAGVDGSSTADRVPVGGEGLDAGSKSRGQPTKQGSLDKRQWHTNALPVAVQSLAGGGSPGCDVFRVSVFSFHDITVPFARIHPHPWRPVVNRTALEVS